MNIHKHAVPNYEAAAQTVKELFSMCLYPRTSGATMESFPCGRCRDCQRDWSLEARAIVDASLTSQPYQVREGKFLRQARISTATWPETDEERVDYQDWAVAVMDGNTILGFRDWLKDI